MGGKRAAWMEILASAVSTACFCKWLIVPGGDTQVFVGRTSDREAAGSMYRHLVGCATSICNMEKRALRDRNPYTDRRQRQQWASEWGDSFLLGFATTVATRLRATRQQLTNESGGTALVLRKDAALQQWWAQQNFNGTRPLDHGQDAQPGRIRDRHPRRPRRFAEGPYRTQRVNPQPQPSTAGRTPRPALENMDMLQIQFFVGVLVGMSIMAVTSAIAF